MDELVVDGVARRGADEHVARHRVAVHQPLGVRGVEGVGHLADDRRRARRRQGTLLGEPGRQVATADQPHVEEQPAVDLAVAVDGHDVGVRQPDGGVRLAAGPFAVAAVGGEVLGEDLERHGALVRGVERAVDLAHPAAADQLLDPVGTELS
nr:hypothetical protein [Geodermatophilus normandii]